MECTSVKKITRNNEIKNEYGNLLFFLKKIVRMESKRNINNVLKKSSW